MDKKTKALVEEYERQREKTIKTVICVVLIVIGASCIVSAFLFRTQYPFSLEDKGKVYYSYSHVLMRDKTRYDMFNRPEKHEILYYIVYRNAGLYYEEETSFTVYAAHANKENVSPGITNHAVIRESVEKYTYIDPYANTYCYDAPTGKLKALFDAAYADGKIYLRFAAYALGAACMATGIGVLIKRVKKAKDEKNQ